jgi:hypothetical protein
MKDDNGDGRHDALDDIVLAQVPAEATHHLTLIRPGHTTSLHAKSAAERKAFPRHLRQAIR